MNDSRTNLVALCKFLSVYLSCGPRIEAEAETRVAMGASAGAKVSVETKIRAGTRVKAQKTAGIEIGILLSSIKALPALQQVLGPAI